MTAKKVECDECGGHPFLTKKVDKMCAKQETRDKEMIEMDRCKVNKSTFNVVAGVIVSLFVGSIGSIIYLVTTVSEVGRNVSLEITEVKSSINERITATNEKTNEKISELQIDVAKIQTQVKDQSDRLFGLAAKTTVLLERMTINDRDARNRSE